MSIRTQIKDNLKQRNLSQKEVSAIIGLSFQNFSSFLRGRRDIPLKESMILDRVLSFEEGYIQKQLLEEKLSALKDAVKDIPYERNKCLILEKVKENGGLWSYEGIPYNLDDDSVIEEGLLHLEFEDMYLLFQNWSKSHIKKIWKERLLSQGKRLNILNTLLGLLFFNCKIDS